MNIITLQDFDKTDDARLLLEMFPTITLLEATHCLSLSNGAMDEAVQIVLHRQEIGESITNTEVDQHFSYLLLVNCLMNTCFKLKKSPSMHKNKPVNEKTLKKKIIEKYSYIDQDDDQREHRPAPLKTVISVDLFYSYHLLNNFFLN